MNFKFYVSVSYHGWDLFQHDEMAFYLKCYKSEMIQETNCQLECKAIKLMINWNWKALFKNQWTNEIISNCVDCTH